MAAGSVQHPVRAVLLVVSKEELWEDGQNGLLSVSGSGQPVGGDARASVERCRIIIPGEGAIESAVFKVWGGDGVGVSGSPPTDASRKGSRMEK